MITARAGRWLRRTAAASAALVVAVLVAATWVYCGQIDRRLLQAGPTRPVYDLEVLAVNDGWVTLSPGPGAGRPGTWGLQWETGYARVGPALVTGEGVRRPLLAVAGSLRAGQAVALDPAAYEGDPADAGVEFENVIVEGPLGNYPAWRTEGENGTWVILVHDRDSSRRQGVRVLPALAAAGFPTLSITYRDDPGAPGAGGRRGLGNPEWEDLEAAVEYAADQGAAAVVLMGYGMGGTTAAMLLHESPRASLVKGLVLDSPLLDPGAAVDADARAHNVPGLIVGWAKGLATLRFGVDWGSLNQVDRAGEFEVPILLFHGEADAVAPVESSERFARLLPRLVRFSPTPGMGHGESWNADPAAYETALVSFLAEVASGPAGP